MWQSIGEVLVSRTLVGLGAQAVFLLVVTLLTIYAILRMRRDTVVILSHGQVLFSTLVATLVCAGVYQGVVWLDPADRWSAGWAIGVVILATFVSRGLTMAIIGRIDGGRSMRDTTAGEGAMFNCNWPLISRCANQGLFLLCVVYLAMHQVWETT